MSKSNSSTKVEKNESSSQKGKEGAQKENVNAGAPKPSVASYHWTLKDGLLLGSISLAAFLFLILFSYDARDPAFNMASTVEVLHNYGGRTGAWLSSFLLYIFGVFAFSLPFGLLIAAWVALRSHPKRQSGRAPRDYVRFSLSLLGLVFFVIAGSGLATLFMPPDNEVVHFPYSAGGVLGYELSAHLVSGLDLLASTLLLLVLLTLSVSLILNTSWLTIFEYTGQGLEALAKVVYPLVLKVGSTVQKRWLGKESRLSCWLSRWQVSKGFAFLNKGGGDLEHAPASKESEAKEKAAESVPLSKLVIPNIVPSSIEKALKEKQVKVPSSPPPAAAQRVEKVSKKKSFFERLVPKVLEAETSEHLDSVGNQAQQASASSLPDEREKVVSELAVSKEEASKRSKGALPDLSLLDEIAEHKEGFSEAQLQDLSFLLEKKLEEFGIKVTVESVQPGPVVTRFEILPAPGVKGSQINNLAKDLARVMSVKSVRVVDIIPGKAVIGIEIPNEEREMVSFREMLSSEQFQKAPSKLTIALGKDISGKPVVADIAKMPHLLVAGTTGAGKSVGINSMILSLLYKATPEEVRLIMVDPKMLELSVYEDIPHLLTPVVTDMSDAANALRWCVFEMDRRYQLMAKLGVRNIAGFNAKVNAAIEAGEPIIDPLYQQMASFGMEQSEAPPTLTPLPYIVVVVDEFADMIMVVGKEVEQLIARIAQKARAAGIHLILATQRPSVNVITGLIKANIPTRISFMVNTKIDSRTILDQGGAEQLLGMGDMLYLPPGSGSPIRVHGAFVSDEEVHRVAEFVKSQGEPQYLEMITKMNSAEGEASSEGGSAEQDPLYDEAVNFVIKTRKVSISLIQRQFKIGYNRSARMVEAMEAAGVISTAGNNGSREVLVPKPGDSD